MSFFSPSHPIRLIPLYTGIARRLFSVEEVAFEFSKYIYIPQEVSEKRDVFTAQTDAVESEVEKHRKNLNPHEEIALHSKILFGNAEHAHLPLIDMGCATIDPYLPELERAFHDFEITDYSVFFTGRSFHIYGHSILEDDAALIRFMGRILLLNLPHRERIIDERWVGHRLMAGYLTLRWTNHNPHYKCLPERYELKGENRKSSSGSVF